MFIAHIVTTSLILRPTRLNQRTWFVVALVFSVLAWLIRTLLSSLFALHCLQFTPVMVEVADPRTKQTPSASNISHPDSQTAATIVAGMLLQSLFASVVFVSLTFRLSCLADRFCRSCSSRVTRAPSASLTLSCSLFALPSVSAAAVYFCLWDSHFHFGLTAVGRRPSC